MQIYRNNCDARERVNINWHSLFVFNSELQKLVIKIIKCVSTTETKIITKLNFQSRFFIAECTVVVTVFGFDYTYSNIHITP